MATEVLSVPEEYLPIVTRVIRAGLSQVEVPEEVREALEEWCEDEEEYCRYANLASPEPRDDELTGSD